MVLTQSNGDNSQRMDYKWIWSFPCTERMRFFLWLLVEDKLNMNQKVQNRARGRMTTNVSCLVCPEEESTSHLFRDCSFAREVWHCWSLYGMPVQGFFQLPFQQWIRSNCSSTRIAADLTVWRISFVTTLWFLWKRRNALVFTSCSDTAGKTWFRAKKMASEIAAVMEKRSQTVYTAKWVSWKVPPDGTYILNTDGALKPDTRQASAGGLLRDHEGQWLKGFCMNIGYTDSLMAELWGLRAGLLLAKQCCVPR